MSDSASATATASETATVQAPGSICHVDFYVPDLEKAKAFYEGVFGWQLQAFQPTEWYFAPASGPCGCLIQGTPATEGASILYMNVDDIPATIAKAKRLGATLVKDRTEIPGGHGFIAHIRAPEGNLLGLWSRLG